MSELRKLGKDLLIKIIEMGTAGDYLTDEELLAKINEYQNILEKRKLEKKTEFVKEKLRQLSVIPSLTQVIEENKDVIDNLKFDLTYINSNKYLTVYDQRIDNISIYYKPFNKFVKLYQLEQQRERNEQPIPLFEITINEKPVWRDIGDYILDENYSITGNLLNYEFKKEG